MKLKLLSRVSIIIHDAIEYNFLWIWRFLFIWGWNGKKNTFHIAFYKPDQETCIWSIGEY
jgi:hypothetical protein